MWPWEANRIAREGGTPEQEAEALRVLRIASTEVWAPHAREEIASSITALILRRGQAPDRPA